MEKPFKLKENGTTLGTEIRAGLTTFVAMAYIIFLNPVFLSNTGMSSAGVLAATCLSAALGTAISALWSNKPFAMASGMGMNAYFTYTLCFGYGYTWQQALVLTFLSGIIFLVLALFMGKKAVSLIPENLRHAITAGIGLFVLLIGLLDAGILQMTAGFPELGDLSSLSVQTALLGLAVTVILSVMGVRGNLILGMLFTAAFSVATGQTGLPDSFVAMPTALKDVAFQMDFAGLISHGSVLTLAAVLVSMSIVDMFDTLGFLIGTVSKTSEKEDSLDRVLAADAGATLIGALCGTSTVTAYAESAAGVEEGGRTGLTALTVSLCFLLAVFFSPITAIFNSAVTAPALVIVGIYLFMDISKVKLEGLEDAIPAVITVAVMPFAYSITAGIGAGFLSFVLCKLTAKKWKEINAVTLILCVVFVLYFLLG